jgi:hypothetical protein
MLCPDNRTSSANGACGRNGYVSSNPQILSRFGDVKHLRSLHLRQQRAGGRESFGVAFRFEASSMNWRCFSMLSAPAAMWR